MAVRTDLALLDERRRGDTEPFRLLVERHGAMVCNAALRVLNDAVGAQDAAQDASLEIGRAGRA